MIINLEKSAAGKKAGDWAQETFGARSVHDIDYKTSIPFVIPVGTIPIPATLNLEGELVGFEGEATVSVMGVEISDVFVSDEKLSATLALSILL